MVDGRNLGIVLGSFDRFGVWSFTTSPAFLLYLIISIYSSESRCRNQLQMSSGSKTINVNKSSEFHEVRTLTHPVGHSSSGQHTAKHISLVVVRVVASLTLMAIEESSLIVAGLKELLLSELSCSDFGSVQHVQHSPCLLAYCKYCLVRSYCYRKSKYLPSHYGTRASHTNRPLSKLELQRRERGQS